MTSGFLEGFIDNSVQKWRKSERGKNIGGVVIKGEIRKALRKKWSLVRKVPGNRSLQINRFI